MPMKGISMEIPAGLSLERRFPGIFVCGPRGVCDISKMVLFLREIEADWWNC